MRGMAPQRVTGHLLARGLQEARRVRPSWRPRPPGASSRASRTRRCGPGSRCRCTASSRRPHVLVPVHRLAELVAQPLALARQQLVIPARSSRRRGAPGAAPAPAAATWPPCSAAHPCPAGGSACSSRRWCAGWTAPCGRSSPRAARLRRSPGRASRRPGSRPGPGAGPSAGCAPKGQVDLLVHLHLVDARQAVLDRVFDGDDLALRRVDLVPARRTAWWSCRCRSAR